MTAGTPPAVCASTNATSSDGPFVTSPLGGGGERRAGRLRRSPRRAQRPHGERQNDRTCNPLHHGQLWEKRARSGAAAARQPSTSSATRRTIAASPPISSVVTIDSRQASRSSRILSSGPISASSSIELRRDRRRRLVLLAVEVEVLDLLRLGLVAHAHRHVVVEVRARGAHAAEVQRVHRAQHVGGRLDVVVDDHRHGRARPRSRPQRAARALAGEALLPARRGRGPRGGARRTAPASRRTISAASATFFGPSAPRKIGMSSRTRVDRRTSAACRGPVAARGSGSG